jgi:uncharacterized membrane protein
VSDQERIARLEDAVRALFAEMTALREETRAAAGPAPQPKPQAPPQSQARPQTQAPSERLSQPPRQPATPRPAFASRTLSETVDFEALVGRYGTMALATLTILLGVGAFLGWAMTHHLLGPWLRIVLGAALAVAIAAAGWRLRKTGAVAFGNALLGLALAVVHVDAWGAGPRLHLIPDTLALTIAAAASAALSTFAQFEGEEALFAVGVGGALLAPFVTVSGDPHVITLLIYGYTVIAVAMVALRERDWIIAVRLLTVGCAVYTTVGIAAAVPGAPATTILAPVAFALAVALTALSVVPRPHRPFVAQSALTIVAVALLFRVTTTHVPAAAAAMAVIGTALAYGSLWTIDETAIDVPSALGVAVLPIAFLVAAMLTTERHEVHSALALGWAFSAVAIATVDSERRIAHWAVAGMIAWLGIAVWLTSDSHQLACVIALTMHAVVCTYLLRRTDATVLAVPALFSLGTAALVAYSLLVARPEYAYTPFLTPASFGALVVSAAWVWFAWEISHIASAQPHPVLRLSGLAVAFIWIRTELAWTGSADISTFLLLAYYAAAGVGAVFLGRARALPVLRHAGLALAIYAAIKTVVEAWSMGIGLRIGSYFVAGLFMMSVAYWYRDSAGRLAPPDAASRATTGP